MGEKLVTSKYLKNNNLISCKQIEQVQRLNYGKTFQIIETFLRKGLLWALGNGKLALFFSEEGFMDKKLSLFYGIWNHRSNVVLDNKNATPL